MSKVSIQLHYNGHIVINNYIFRIITTRCVLSPVSYLINWVKVMYQRISRLKFIFSYPPLIHNIHSLSRKNDDIMGSHTWAGRSGEEKRSHFP